MARFQRLLLKARGVRPGVNLFFVVLSGFLIMVSS